MGAWQAGHGKFTGGRLAVDSWQLTGEGIRRRLRAKVRRFPKGVHFRRARPSPGLRPPSPHADARGEGLLKVSSCERQVLYARSREKEPQDSPSPRGSGERVAEGRVRGALAQSERQRTGVAAAIHRAQTRGRRPPVNCQLQTVNFSDTMRAVLRRHPMGAITDFIDHHYRHFNAAALKAAAMTTTSTSRAAGRCSSRSPARCPPPSSGSRWPR